MVFMKVAPLILGSLASLCAMTVGSAKSTDHLGKVTAGDSDAFAFASTSPPKSFTDYVVFDLTSSLDISETLMAFGVNNLVVDLQEKIGGVWTTEEVAATPTSYDFGDLSSGKWRLDITGKTAGVSGSDSSLFGHLNVAAVPEPGTLAMFLAGAGLLGVYQWRRRHKSAEQPISGGAA
jgi:hypothetical protein